jgi:deoxyribonuclease V
MRGKLDPDWRELVESWKQTQRDLRQRLVVRRLDPLPRFVAGADAAYSSDKHTAYAAAVIYDRQEQRIVEVAHAVCTIDIPYIPGFLSFREGPPIMAAMGKLQHPFGAICFDGQGYAHPRRCGLASHVAIMLDVPGVGVAKSRFIGEFAEPDASASASSALMDAEEQIGLVLRTRQSTQPLFISIGHKIDLASAKELVLACCTRFRIPEPTRQADIEVAKLKRASLDGATSKVGPV